MKHRYLLPPAPALPQGLRAACMQAQALGGKSMLGL